jgi:hypothetical protein
VQPPVAMGGEQVALFAWFGEASAIEHGTLLRGAIGGVRSTNITNLSGVGDRKRTYVPHRTSAARPAACRSPAGRRDRVPCFLRRSGPRCRGGMRHGGRPAKGPPAGRPSPASRSGGPCALGRLTPLRCGSPAHVSSGGHRSQWQTGHRATARPLTPPCGPPA